MANDTPTSTSFSAENQPHKRRGKSFKTMVVEALVKQGKTESEFVELLVERAIKDGGVYLTELLRRYSPPHKATMEPIVIDNWPKDGTSAQKSDAILNAMAEGVVPFDLGVSMIDAISKSLGIEEVTDFMQRVVRLEELINGKD